MPHKRNVCFETPILFCFCCGGIGFLVLLKACLLLAPILIASEIVFTTLAILFIPVVFVCSYKAMFFTPRLGPAVKLVFACFLWIPAIAYPIVAPLASLIFAVVITCYYSVTGTMADDNMWIGGIVDCFKSLGRYIEEVWNYGTKEIPLRCAHIEKPTNDYNRYNFNILWFIPAVVCGFLGFAIVGTFAFFQYIIKFVFIMVSMAVAYVKLWARQESCFKFVITIPWLFGWFLYLLLPVAGLIAVLVFSAYGFKLFIVPFLYKEKLKAIGYCLAGLLLDAELFANWLLEFGFGEHACCIKIKKLESRFDMGNLSKKSIRVLVRVDHPPPSVVEVPPPLLLNDEPAAESSSDYDTRIVEQV